MLAKQNWCVVQSPTGIYLGLGRTVSNKASLEVNSAFLNCISCSSFAVCCSTNMEKDFTSIEVSIIISELSKTIKLNLTVIRNMSGVT